MTEQKMYEEEIDLGALILMLWRQLWKLIVVAVVAAVLVYAVIPRATSESFTASVDLYIGYEDEYAENKPDLKMTVESCAALIKTTGVLTPVKESLNLQQSVDELAGLITVSTVDDSSVLQLKVISDDKNLAENLAVAMAEEAEATVSEMMGYAFCRQVGNVETSSSVSGRNVVKYSLVAAILAAVIGAILLLCRELFDRSIKDCDGAAAVTGLPVLGAIPELKSDRKQKKDHPRNDQQEQIFAYAEAYKSLRTSFLFKAEEAEAKTIVLTSSIGDEDVYNTAVNLSKAMAEAGKKTLIVDCDLRAAALADYIGISEETGVGDVLSGQTAVQACIYDTSTKYLKVMLAGRKTEKPSELLSRESLRSMMEAMKESFDYVIIAAPPVSVVTDAAVLASVADGVLLVTRARFAKTETVQLAIDKLQKVRGNVLGIVLTRLDMAKLYNKSGYAQAFKETYPKK